MGNLSVFLRSLSRGSRKGRDITYAAQRKWSNRHIPARSVMHPSPPLLCSQSTSQLTPRCRAVQAADPSLAYCVFHAGYFHSFTCISHWFPMLLPGSGLSSKSLSSEPAPHLLSPHTALVSWHNSPAVSPSANFVFHASLKSLWACHPVSFILQACCPNP